MTQTRQKENAMMKTLLFATAIVTALAAAAPAVARGPHRYYGYYSDYGMSYAFRPYDRVRIPRSAYGYYYAPYNPNDPNGYHGYVENNWATYCNQMPKAC